MSTAFRRPTINRLQRLLTTHTLPSPSPSLPSRRLLLPRQTTGTSLFSTSSAARNKPNTTTTTNNTKGSSNAKVDTTASGNPAYPKFNLRSIVPNPRMRKALMVVLGVMVVAESWMWITYWPRVMGWWKGGEGNGTEGEGSG
ncbi:hypothetical protein F5144DRAFT_633240 [Chaetomium tenue]|uniref:Uncharacterized protein n=1 Tax=Chaetomium tenue TaxID=1854479 RepID=A0ACB7NZD3_9PEZI|nr:hypothetical protein F5144DRAFT_633240 [Chaetomium globosum]